MSALKKGVLKLAGGAGVSQLIVVAATPLLTRLYAPGAFGEFAVFASIYTIVVGLATLRLEQAIVLPPTAAEAARLARLTLRLAAVGAALSFVVLVPLGQLRELGAHHYLLPVAIFVGAVQSVGQYWCTRDRAFGPIASSAITGAIANVGSSIGFWFAGLRDGGLVLAYVVGSLVTAVHLWATQRGALRLIASRDARPTWALLSGYSHFPAHVVPAGLATTIGSHAMPIVITQFVGPHAAGLYAIANRFLALPTLFVGNAIQAVFNSEFNARLNAGGDTRALFDRVLVALLLFAIPAFLAIGIVSPWLFGLVFGPEYVEAGEIARYICIGVAGAFVAAPLVPVFIALRRTGIGLVLQATSSLAPILAFAIGFGQGGLSAGLAWAAAVAFACSMGLVAFARRHVVARAGSASS